MPSKSKAQADVMAAIAHGAKLNMAHPPPRSVAMEFNRADSRTGILRGKRVPPRRRR